MCGVVTYEHKGDGSIGCTMALVPAPSCVLRLGGQHQGVMLYPREQVTRITTDAPSSNRNLAFPGTRRGVGIGKKGKGSLPVGVGCTWSL